jgi:hypothetical protein
MYEYLSPLKGLSGYGSQAFAFARKFPEAAGRALSLSTQATASMASLSPKARANLHALMVLLWSVILWMFVQGQGLYRKFMAIPRRPLTEWRRPFALTLSCLSSLVLFLFPVRSTVSWESGQFLEDKTSKTRQTFVFVSNRNMYALDAIPLMASIYKNTGIWPRFATDPYHFKIPLWKHLIEYFGAYPYDRHLTNKLLAAGFSVVISPGGYKETLKTKTSVSYQLQWDSFDYLKDIPESSQIIPVSFIGPNDMFEHIYDIDITPLLWITGDKETKRSLPILYPKSFQRSYVCFGPAGQFDEKTTTECVAMGLEKARLARQDDPGRYLLTRIGALLKTGNKWMIQKLCSAPVKKLVAKLGSKAYNLGVYCLENADLDTQQLYQKYQQSKQ